MNRDDVIRMARKVWGQTAVLPFDSLGLFADLVAAHEREECARVCDDLAKNDSTTNYYLIAARTIRARGER